MYYYAGKALTSTDILTNTFFHPMTFSNFVMNLLSLNITHLFKCVIRCFTGASLPQRFRFFVDFNKCLIVYLYKSSHAFFSAFEFLSYSVLKQYFPTGIPSSSFPTPLPSPSVICLHQQCHFQEAHYLSLQETYH